MGVMDRIDEMVKWGLPGAHERRKMIAMYIEKYLINPPGKWAKKVTTVDIGDEEIERFVAETEGFSGRAISKLAIAWQAAAYELMAQYWTKRLFSRQWSITKTAWLKRMNGLNMHTSVLKCLRLIVKVALKFCPK